RADVAHDHEGRRTLAEALMDVRAGGFLAHRVQLVLAQRGLDLVEALGLGTRAEADADPVRLLEPLGRYDLDRDAGGLVGAALLAGGGFHQGSFWFPLLRRGPGRAGRDCGGKPRFYAVRSGSRRCRWPSRRAPTASRSSCTPKSASCVVFNPS